MTAAPGMPLTAADQLLLRGDADPRRRSAYTNVEVLDRVPQWSDLVIAFERASRAVPRLRQHVVAPLLPTTAPRWAVDPDFDLTYHLRRVRLPGPGTHRELMDFAEILADTPLDPARPLWTATLVEGLDNDCAALVTTMSHAVTDGVGAVVMFEQIYDTTREGRSRPMPLLPVPEDIDPGNLAKQGLRELPGRTAGVAKDAVGIAAKAVLNPTRSAGGVLGYAASFRRVLGATTSITPSPLLARRGLKRRTVTLDLDFTTFKTAAERLGGTVNDAYVAAVCGAIRRYHEAKGVAVQQLPMAIPVNMRRDGDSEGGNRWTGMIFAAPIGETDPAARIATIGTQVSEGKKESAADLLGVASHVVSVLPNAVATPLVESVRPADVQCSNVRSYPGETYLAGAQVIAQYPMGPVPGVGAMVVLVSRMGRIFIGARYDVEAFADGAAFERALAEGFEEVVIAAGLTWPLAGTQTGAEHRRPTTRLTGSARPAAASRASATPKAAAARATADARTSTPRKTTTRKTTTRKAATRKADTRKTARKSAAKSGSARKKST